MLNQYLITFSAIDVRRFTCFWLCRPELDPVFTLAAPYLSKIIHSTLLILNCLDCQARKVGISIPGRKKCAVKKQEKKSSSGSVPGKNQDILRRYRIILVPL